MKTHLYDSSINVLVAAFLAVAVIVNLIEIARVVLQP
jgi:hypothetical protein